jgi:tRNA threonylcarbamoyl adenosine modification protein YjeE
MFAAMDAPDRDRVIATGPRAVVRRIGARWGEAARPGDVIALVGGLGAGKTFVAQAIVHGAGVPREVRVASPTFTIVQSYTKARLPVMHADLYRLGSLAEIDEIGLFDEGAEGLVVVEWADRFVDAVPRDALWVELRKHETNALVRTIAVGGKGDRVDRLIEAALRPRDRLL